MIEYINYIIIIILGLLFIYSGVDESERRVNDNFLKIPEFVSNIENMKRILRENTYIDSIWLYTKNEKIIIQRNSIKSIPPNYNIKSTPWIKKTIEGKLKDGHWSEPFQDEIVTKLMLLPYTYYIKNKGCVAYMFRFYS